MSIFEWDIRASKYDNLEWTNRDQYMEKFLKICDLKSNFHGCDIGTETGIIASVLANYCKKVDAIDYSKAILDIAKKKRRTNNIRYLLMNAEKLEFFPCIFDIVTARMCFHHIAHQDKAINECVRILKPGRKFVISEGIPPPGTRKFYTEMFKLKEKRRTYTIDDLVELLEHGGLKNITIEIHKMPSVSINNWLVNSGKDKSTCKKIYDMHLDCEEYVKKAYNMKTLNGDIFMDWLIAIVSGTKPQ
jgi:ubiquinone/menaquinone biosynthesis C-methylase UbiE